MLTYEKILYATTRILDKNFSCDVFVESEAGIFENECLFVSIVPVSYKSDSFKIAKENLIISIKYFNGSSKIKNYEVAKKLKELFGINIKVEDRTITVSNIEPNFLKDDVGDMLDFLIYLSYYDETSFIEEHMENMQEIILNTKG